MTAQPPPLIILTGMSGAGRTTAANVFEDNGWYVIDNLPPQLLPSIAQLLQASDPGEMPPIAAVVDVRSRMLFTDFQAGLDGLRDAGYQPTVLFLDATDEALVRRFESVRRPHPLQGEGRMLDGIHAERKMLGDLRSNAEIIIDTSGLNVHQLSARVRQLVGGSERPAMRVAVMSFGFKYGIPLDADLVFDMRFLPNPYWNPELRPYTGQDPIVADFVLSQEGAEEFLEHATGLLEPMLAGYQREGRAYVTIGIGCTGGKHRSVAMAEALAERIRSDSITAIVVHRDLGRE